MIPMHDLTFAALIRIASDSHIARSPSILAACLLLSQSLGLAATPVPDHARIRFAVIPWRVGGDPDLGAAIAFDLEKRLERWPCMEDVERLDLQRALRRASSGTEKAAVATVLEKLQADIVIVISGSGKEGRLRLSVDLWKSATTLGRDRTCSNR